MFIHALVLSLFLCLALHQIEAALSRMPGAGGRVTLQTRLDEVRAAQDCFEIYINRINVLFFLFVLFNVKSIHSYRHT